MNTWAAVSAVTGLSMYLAPAKVAALGWGVSVSGVDIALMQTLGGAIAGKALLIGMLSDGYYPVKVLGCTAVSATLQQLHACFTNQRISAAQTLLLLATTTTAVVTLLG